MVKLLLFCFRVTNSKLRNKKIHFELLTRLVNFYIFTFELGLGLGSNKIDIITEKAPKMSGVLRGNYCETCRNIPQKTRMKKFTKKNSLTKQMLFRNV